MKMQEKGPCNIIYKADQVKCLIPRVVCYTAVKKHGFNNFNKNTGKCLWYDGQEKGCQLNNLKYLSKMHSTKETRQNINHGYV